MLIKRNTQWIQSHLRMICFYRSSVKLAVEDFTHTSVNACLYVLHKALTA